MGYLKKICVGAAAVVSSALLGYFLYKTYFQSKEVYDHSKIVKPHSKIWQSYTNDIFFNRTSMKKKMIHLKLNQIQPK